MRIGWRFIFYALLLTSCDLFTTQDQKTQDLVNQELLTIDWNSVEHFPRFEICKKTDDKAEQRDCFEAQMLQHVSLTLSDLNYRVQEHISNELYIDFIVDEHGFIRTSAIQENEVIAEAMPGFYNEIRERLNDLTMVEPAYYRGVPVKMKFRLPIVLNTN